MSSTARQFKTGNAEAQIAAAYNEAGYRYGKYADGGGRTLFTFDGRHAYGDRKSWETIETKLLGLRARGLCELDGVQLTYGFGDLRGEIDAPQADICLCLYGVLNHVPVADLPDVMRRVAALTTGYFIATVRAAGSQPTVYVDEVSAALRFHQDNQVNRLDVEFANGRRASFQSHLFNRAELERLAAQGFAVEEIRGLDLFHGRFASDPGWNPKNTAFSGRLAQELGRLEDRYCCDPGFVDHAAHLLLVARHKAMVRP